MLPENEKPNSEDLAWIKQFIFCITAKEGINATSKLIFTPSRQTMCIAHTCFSTMDIPIEKSDKNTFFNLLQYTLNETEFTRA